MAFVGNLKRRLTRRGQVFMRRQVLTVGQAQQLERWRDLEALRVFRSFGLVSPFISLVGVVGFLTLAPAPMRLPGVVFSAALSLNALVALAIERYASPLQLRFALRANALISTVIGAVAFALLLYLALTEPGVPAADFVVAGLIWIWMLWYVGAYAVLFGRYILLLKIVHAIPPLLAFSLAHSPETPSIFLALIFMDGFVAAYFSLLNARGEDSALLALRSQKLEMQNESLRLQAIETELSLVRELGNLAKIPESVQVGRCRIAAYHVPFGILGGDWMASRHLADGRYVIVVGDVTGKGVPAAMVVQAVQSLWAAHLHIDHWEPMTWFSAVNRSLRTMGRRHAQTLSVGMVILDGRKLTYISAGHVPLYIVADVRDRNTGRFVGGSGQILGIYADPQIVPVTVELPDLSPYAVLLGTDGILDWQTRKSSKRAFQLLQQVEARGADAIKDHPVDDDKILVTILA